MSLSLAKDRELKYFYLRPPILPRPGQHSAGRIYSRFREAGSVSDKSKLGRPRTETDDESNVVLLDKIAVRPQRLVGNFISEIVLTDTCLRRIMQLYEFRPYRLRFVLELHGDDTHRQI